MVARLKEENFAEIKETFLKIDEGYYSEVTTAEVISLLYKYLRHHSRNDVNTYMPVADIENGGTVRFLEYLLINDPYKYDRDQFDCGVKERVVK